MSWEEFFKKLITGGTFIRDSRVVLIYHSNVQIASYSSYFHVSLITPPSLLFIFDVIIMHHCISGLYTVMLIPPAIVGIISIIYGLLTVSSYVTVYVYTFSCLLFSLILPLSVYLSQTEPFDIGSLDIVLIQEESFCYNHSFVSVLKHFS